MTHDNVVSLAECSASETVEIYERLLRPAFRSDELLSLDEFVAAYTGEESEPSGVLLRDGKPIAAFLGEWYVDHHVLLLAYLAVDPEARGQGAGSCLIDVVVMQLQSMWPDAMVLGEVDDPRVWPGDALTGDARARLRFYERRAARLLPVRYFQPALREDMNRVHGMFLMRLDQGASAPQGDLRQFLVEYFTTCEGPGSLDDPEVAELLGAAEALDINHGLLSLSQWPRMPSPRSEP